MPSRSKSIYYSWSGMKSRCQSTTNTRYADYGGRGITVCDAWQSWDAFYTDMAASWKPGLTLERNDNNKGYSKENCRWATRAEQRRNQRTRCDAVLTQEKADEIRALYKTKQYTQKQLAILYGIDQGKVCRILQHNLWPVRTTAEAQEGA